MTGPTTEAALREKLKRALATEDGTGQTNPLARDFLDTSDRFEIYFEAAQAWLAALRVSADTLTETLTLAREQFAWIEREAYGDNEVGRIVHACQRAYEAIDAALAAARPDAPADERSRSDYEAFGG